MDESIDQKQAGTKTADTSAQKQLYPVFLKLAQLDTLLVGAGNVGLAILNSLLANSPHANVTIVAPRIKDELRQLASGHKGCRIFERGFEPGDLSGKDLAILATDDHQLHEQIRLLADETGVLLNVADTPDLCDFYLGS